MNPGEQVFEWMRQNDYTPAQIAGELGYPAPTFTQALERNQITPQMANALFERYGLRVAPTVPSSAEEASDQEAPGAPESQEQAYSAPKADAEVGDIAEATPETYPPATDPIEKYRQEVRRILDESRCRGI